jgi:hypothetical protein
MSEINWYQMLAHFGQVSVGVTGCATHLTMLFPLTWNDMLAKVRADHPSTRQGFRDFFVQVN